MADVRLIDRKALLKALRKEKRECEKDGEEFGGESILYAEAFEDAIDMVKNLPVVDAVPVVRCRECKYRHSSEFCECRPEDAFCSDGEKMDEPSPQNVGQT